MSKKDSIIVMEDIELLPLIGFCLAVWFVYTGAIQWEIMIVFIFMSIRGIKVNPGKLFGKDS